MRVMTSHDSCDMPSIALDRGNSGNSSTVALKAPVPIQIIVEKARVTGTVDE